MRAFVRDNDVEQALRILKRKMQREGVFREMRRRRFYEKPSDRATREKAEAVRRARLQSRELSLKRDRPISYGGTDGDCAVRRHLLAIQRRSLLVLPAFRFCRLRCSCSARNALAKAKQWRITMSWSYIPRWNFLDSSGRPRVPGGSTLAAPMTGHMLPARLI